MDKKTKKLISPHSASITVLIAIVANIGVQLVAGIIVVLSNDETLADSAVFNLTMMILIQVAFLVVYYLTVHLNDYSLLVSVKNRPSKNAVLFTPVFALCSILAFYSPTILFSLGLEGIGYKSPAFVDLNTPLEFVLGVFAIVIAAPIVEELIFRGVLLSGLSQAVEAKYAVLMSALAFMLMHFSPAQTVYQFLLAVVLGVIAIKTKSLLLPMLIHAFSNLFALLLDYTPLNKVVESLFTHLSANVFVAIGTAIMFTVVFCAVLYLLCDKLFAKKKEGEEGEQVITSQNKPLATKPLLGEDGTTSYVGYVDEEKEGSQVEQKNRYKGVYFLAIGLCIFMWLSSLLVGMSS